MSIAAITYGRTASEVMKVTGATYRQLDYWCRSGWLGEELRDLRSGNWRSFSQDQVRRVFMLVKASTAGIDVAAVVAKLPETPIKPGCLVMQLSDFVIATFYVP